MMTYMIIGITAFGFLFLVNKKKKSGQGEFFISTISQSVERIQKLILDKSTEDISYPLSLLKN